MDELTKDEIRLEKIMEECREDTAFDVWFSDNKTDLESEYCEENNDDFMEFVKQQFNEEND